MNYLLIFISDGAALPYPTGYMQPFFPMPPGYNPYNPFFNTSKFINLSICIVWFVCFFALVAPPYPMAGAPQYPQQGNAFNYL